MSKGGMSVMLKNRMLATQQASELEVGNEAYETLFHTPTETAKTTICKLPISKLHPFFHYGYRFQTVSRFQVGGPCRTYGSRRAA